MTTPGGVAAHYINHRYHGSFPTRWERPEGDGPFSPARAAWIRRMVEEHELGRVERRSQPSTSGERRYPTDRAAIELRLLYLSLPGPGA